MDDGRNRVQKNQRHLRSPGAGARTGERLAAEPTLAAVVGVSGCELALVGSQLEPSRPGVAGDRGSVAGQPVLEVIREAGRVVHVFRNPLNVREGQEVEVRLDLDRRQRLERTHAAVVLVRIQLQRRGVEVFGGELTAGRAWLEVASLADGFGVADMIARDLPIRRRAIGSDRLLVRCGQDVVVTEYGPLSARTGDIGIAEVTAVAGADGVTVAVALVDAKERWWE